MNIEGNTYLFYDKYCGDHGLKNPKTINITLNELYTGDYKIYNGIDAIREFNKFKDVQLLPLDINVDFYQITFFEIPKTNIDDDKKFLTVCVNHQKLKDNIDNIPNKYFLIDTCSWHCAYNMTKKEQQKTNDLIKLKSIEANTDPTDPIIEEPSFTNLSLFQYQKRTIKWILDTELQKRKINYSHNDEIYFGDIVYDSVRKSFIPFEDRKKITFTGGLIADEMGLGKTFEMIVASLMNPSTDISYLSDDIYLKSRATLIICQNQLAKQWIREFEKTIKPEYNLKIVQLFTKTQHDKITYLDLLDADFIVVSFPFLGNECYYESWIKKICGTKKGLTWVNSENFSEEKAQEKILETINNIKKEPSKLFDKKPLLNCVKYYRCIVDEFHSLVTDTKNSYILKILKLIKSDYRWVMTGTPFDKNDQCLEKMVDYVINYKITSNLDQLLDIDIIQKYLLNKFYRKNTNKSRENEYKLKPLKEEIIKLKFTPTERALYNAYIVNSNVDKYSVLVRQACCDPRIIDELKDELAGCKTPEDIQATLVNHHKKTTEIASKKVRYIKYKIKKCERKIKVTEFKRYRKYLKQIGYRVEIIYPEKVKDSEFDNKENLQELDPDDLNEINDNDSSDDSDNEDNNKPLMIVNEENITNITKLISKQININPSITLNSMQDALEKLNNKLKEEIKQYDGKKSTSEFFNNMMDKINKITEKQKNKKDDEEYEETDEDEMCSICINPITGEDVGVTKCGHMYCYQCIKEMIQSNPKCPQCMKPTKANEIYMISFEDLSRKTQTKEIKDKISIINKVGTKLANLIFYIKNCKDKCIIFSQWDDLLKKVGDILDTYGINNVFCRGNVWTRDKAIRDFTTKENIRIIMLSSASAAAGTNLTAAKKVILLEPVNGTYEFRKNTENQAIGRAQRTGQIDQVSVVRFIIKDTIEEEIYNENIKEDAKFKSDMEIQMLTDDNLNLTNEQIDIIAKDEEINLKKKELKPKKKTKQTEKKKVIEINEDLDSSDDE